MVCIWRGELTEKVCFFQETTIYQTEIKKFLDSPQVFAQHFCEDNRQCTTSSIILSSFCPVGAQSILAVIVLRKEVCTEVWRKWPIFEWFLCFVWKRKFLCFRENWYEGYHENFQQLPPKTFQFLEKKEVLRTFGTFNFACAKLKIQLFEKLSCLTCGKN